MLTTIVFVGFVLFWYFQHVPNTGFSFLLEMTLRASSSGRVSSSQSNTACCQCHEICSQSQGTFVNVTIFVSVDLL